MSGSHLQMTENDAYVTRQSSPSHYGYTKAEAEKLVRVARRVLSRNLLRCVAACCLRYIYMHITALWLRQVIAANGSATAIADSVLHTACIRPCSAIFGPNDRLITERQLKQNSVQVVRSRHRVPCGAGYHA